MDEKELLQLYNFSSICAVAPIKMQSNEDSTETTQQSDPDDGRNNSITECVNESNSILTPTEGDELKKRTKIQSIQDIYVDRAYTCSFKLKVLLRTKFHFDQTPNTSEEEDGSKIYVLEKENERKRSVNIMCMIS